ncbi:hypothetical protein B5M09_010712, partial [Aphanomyces astaci]
MADNADTVIARRKSPGRPAFKYGRKAVPKLFKNKTVDYKHRLEAIIKYLPTKTLNEAKENTVWGKRGGKTKDRAMAMLLADSTGAKHPLFLVLKTTKSTVKEVVQENLKKSQEFGKKVWREVLPLQRAHRCQIYGN